MPIIIPAENLNKASDILDAVRALGYATDTEAAQLQMLNQIQRRIVNARRWTFMLATETFTTVAGEQNVPYSELTNNARVDAVRLAGVELTYIDEAEIRQYSVENTQAGSPKNWSLRENNIVIYPIPDAEYELQVDLVNSAPTVVEAESEVVVPSSHIDILVWGIIMQLTFRERDWDGHNFARQMYAELFTEMLAQYGMKQRQRSTHVSSSGSWENFDVEEAWPTSAQ